MVGAPTNSLDTKVGRILDRHQKLKAERQPWITTWQLVAEYVRSRKANFTYEFSPGQFLTGKIFDSTASQANHKMAASLIGALYPNGSKSIEIKPHSSLRGKDREDVKAYFEEITHIVVRTLGNYKGGFSIALQEYMNDQGAFGTSGISVLPGDDDDVPVKFKAVDVKSACIDENKDGLVDTVYIEMNMTVKQLVEEYGYDAVSEQSRKRWDDRDFGAKVKVLHAIEPRMISEYGPGNKRMPIGSYHVELDARIIIKESGFTSMPVFMTRFWKESGEKYGRSPAMECMSDILEANAVREAAILAIEKSLDPPLALYDDGALGGGVVDTSAGALSVFKISGAMTQSNRRIIEQLVTTGELNSTYKHLIELHDIITDNFFIDRLTDLNNDTRMTLGEANIRNELRGQSLGSIYERQIVELFSPVIERVVSILLDKGLLGVVPGSWQHMQALEFGEDPLVIPDVVVDALMRNREVYEINYISPAMRIMRQEELTGITRTVEFAANIAAVRPDIMDNLDLDKIMRRVQELTGAPADTLQSMQKVIDIREARAKREEQMAQMQMQVEAAKAAQHVGVAAQAGANAQRLAG